MQTYIQRLVSSFAGGMAGTLGFVVIYFLTVLLIPKDSYNPTSGVAILFMIFLGSMLNAIVSNILITISQREKYTQMKRSLMHTFAFNLVIFTISTPFYFFFDQIQDIALVYLIISAVSSNIILESFAIKGNYILTGIYGSLAGSFLVFITFLMLSLNFTDFTYIFFFIMPIINMTISICTIVTEFIAGEIYDTLKVNPFDTKNNEKVADKSPDINMQS